MKNSSAAPPPGRLRPDPVLRPTEGRRAAYDGPGTLTQILNFTAALVLAHCDGRHEPRAIADAVAGSVGPAADPEAVRAEVEWLIAQVGREGRRA